MFSHPAWKALIFVLLSMGWAAQALAGVYFIHADHLGTPRVVSDQIGTVVWKADYDAFGKATLTTNVYALNLRFPGQYFDAETNLHFNYFRDYDPSVGRYLQSDPIGLEGGINTYAYVENNPVRYVDPTGEFIPNLIVGTFAGFISGAINVYTNSANDCISLSDSFLAGFLGGFAGGLTLNPVLGGALSGGITNGLNSRYSGGSRAHQGASAMLGGVVGIGTGAVAGYVGGFSNKIVAGASSAAAGTTANVVLSLSGSELGCTCPR